MTDLSSKACVVFDHGIFSWLAFRMAESFGKVYYVSPWESAWSKIDQAIIGDGFGEIERVEEIWDVIDKVDLAVFPDVHHGGMQLAIEKYVGVPVWGGRKADSLELKKLQFKKLQAELGMNVGEYDIVDGLDALREYCRKHKDRWIKMTPQFRGNKETFHYEDYEEAQSHLDEMAVDFGILQNTIKFLAEKPIKAKLEGGVDTYTVDGMHPSVAVQGYEAKDMCYFATVQKYSELPEELRIVNEMLWPTLRGFRCRQMVSTEVKITDDDESFLLEPTIRFPSPAGEEQAELYGNLPEIIYEGAQGRLVEPDVTAKFACEAMVEHKGNKDKWRRIVVPEEFRRWIKLYSVAQIGESIGVAPGAECIGAVVGIGDTPKECLAHLKENAECLKDQPVIVHIESLAGIFDEIEQAQDAGIHFTDKPMPEPADALDL